MTLAIGDRVRITYASVPAIGTVVRNDAQYDPTGRAVRVRIDTGIFTGEHAARCARDLEKIEVEQPRPLGLEPGDKVVNLKTGREGLVLKGPISGELKVYDQKPPIKTAVPAQALEEYEFHYPGTYDVWRRVVNPGTRPW